MKYGLFRTIKASFVKNLELSQVTFEYYAGQICDIDCDTQYLVVPETIEKIELEKLKLDRKSAKLSYKIITEDYIDACIEDNNLISDVAYLL